MILWALLFASGLFVGLIVMQQPGHRPAARRIDPEGVRKGADVIDGAGFGDFVQALPGCRLETYRDPAEAFALWTRAGHDPL